MSKLTGNNYATILINSTYPCQDDFDSNYLGNKYFPLQYRVMSGETLKQKEQSKLSTVKKEMDGYCYTREQWIRSPYLICKTVDSIDSSSDDPANYNKAIEDERFYDRII